MVIGVIPVAVRVAYIANWAFGTGLALFGAGLLLTGFGAPAGIGPATWKI